MRAGRRRLLYAALLAVGLHLDLLLVFGFMLHGVGHRLATTSEVDEAIGLETIDGEAAREILAEADKAAEQAEADKTEKEKESTDLKGQVVDLPAPATEERPKDAKYLAEHDSKVEHETKKQGRYEDAKASNPMLAMRGPVGRSATPPAPAERSGARPAPQGAPAEVRGGPPQPTDPDGALDPAPQASRAGKESEALAGANSKRPGAPMALLPNSMQLARAIGGGTQDHLPDVDDGDTTGLNAKSWKFASFFNRIKRQVAQHWRPAEQYEKRDPTGNIYGSGQWVTMLRIALSPDGSVNSVAVEKPCGLEFLDDEAVEAIKKGGPYPNPPSQLVGDGGVISFRFGFFFDVAGGPRMKVYRYSGI